MKGISLQEKMSIKTMLAAGKKYPAIAKELNLNLKTVEKWGLIIKRDEDLTPKMGRPAHGLLSTFDEQIHQQIDNYRPQKDGWGAITIQVEMKLDPQNEGKKLPSIRSINSYLHERQRTEKRDKRVALKIPSAYPTDSCHDLWQLDAEGNSWVDPIGTVAFLNIKDVFSKTAVQLFPCQLKGRYNHPTTIDYQTVMRLAMMEFGKCKRLQVDHESIYFDNVNSSPYPTNFHLWLIGLQIQMCLTPKGQPQKQGMVERSHQTARRQVLGANQYFYDWRTLFEYCQHRRMRLNYHLPNRNLKNQPPLVAFPMAKHSAIFYHPKMEENEFNYQAIKQYLQQGKWYRKVASSRTVSIGNYTYYLSQAKAGEEMMVTFDADHQHFTFQRADGHVVGQQPVKGLNFKELAGNIDDFITTFGHLTTKIPTT